MTIVTLSANYIQIRKAKPNKKVPNKEKGHTQKVIPCLTNKKACLP